MGEPYFVYMNLDEAAYRPLAEKLGEVFGTPFRICHRPVGAEALVATLETGHRIHIHEYVGVFDSDVGGYAVGIYAAHSSYGGNGLRSWRSRHHSALGIGGLIDLIKEAINNIGEIGEEEDFQ